MHISLCELLVLVFGSLQTLQELQNNSVFRNLRPAVFVLLSKAGKCSNAGIRSSCSNAGIRSSCSPAADIFFFWILQ